MWQGGGEEVWDPLREAGLLDSQDATTQPTSQGQEVAAAVSSRQVIAPSSNQDQDVILSGCQNPVT